jgi:hypothetical protein
LISLPSKKIKDIRGERFGRLVVEDFSHISLDKGRNAHWDCRCDCGINTVVSSSSLRTGVTKSCGCIAREESRKRIKKLHNIGDHLYFIRTGPYVKIGRANRVDLRLGQIRAMNPYGAEIIAVYEYQGYREKEVHNRYQEKLHTGEWFKLSDSECEI